MSSERMGGIGSELAVAPSLADRPTWIVMLSGSPWPAAAHRQQEIARELARGGRDGGGAFRVLFVDPPSNHRTTCFSVSQVADSLWHATVPSPLPFGRQVPPFNSFGRRKSAGALRNWLDARPGARVLWVDEDLAAPMVGHLGEAAVVYDATDLDWTFTRRWNRWHLRWSLARAVRAADLVLASSTALPERLPPSRSHPVVVANACDTNRFRPDGATAAWLSELPRPLLGYVGSVDLRAFDADLVAAVAAAHPDWTFVLVGPSTTAGRAPLVELPNVRMFGPVPFEQTASVMRSFDVGLIPYRTGGLVDYVHPKKCYEYLATGLPVVATPLPALSDLDAPVRLASTPADFARAIEAALLEGDPRQVEERRASTRSHDWQNRGDQLRLLLREWVPA